MNEQLPGGGPAPGGPTPAPGQPAWPAPSEQPQFVRGPQGPGWAGPPGPGWVEPPRPGVVPLRPLGLGEILDGAVQIMRHNPRVMFGLSAVVATVTTVLSTIAQVLGLSRLMKASQATATSATVTTDDAVNLASGTLTAAIAPALVQGVALSVLTGVLIVAVSEAVIGRRPDVGQVARRVGWGGVGRLVALTLLIGVIALVGTALLALPVVGLYFWNIPAGVIGTVLALVLLVGLSILLTVRLSFAAPALLLEGIGIGAALARSWRLVSGSWWRVLGILLLTSLIASFASGLLQAPFSVVGIFLSAGLSATAGGADGSVTAGLVTSTVVTNLGLIVGTTVVAPFSAAVTSLLYIDLRMRREGLDVALARAAQDVQDAPRR